jgi:hypothetical protein
VGALQRGSHARRPCEVGRSGCELRVVAARDSTAAPYTAALPPWCVEGGEALLRIGCRLAPGAPQKAPAAGPITGGAYACPGCQVKLVAVLLCA